MEKELAYMERLIITCPHEGDADYILQLLQDWEEESSEPVEISVRRLDDNEHILKGEII